MVKCEVCGNEMVEQRMEGIYCSSCRNITKTPERAVRHEGFPYVTGAGEEP